MLKIKILIKPKKIGSLVEITEEDNFDPKIFFAEADSIPNMLYSPENIFANNIAALDINFLRPNTYQAVTKSIDSSAEEKAESSAAVLSKTIAAWYKSFRNIAIVGLLSVLIYLGIRILITSTAADKAKYKETLKDWFVALCLVFVIHFIMSGILMLTDKVNELFGDSVEEGIIVHIEEGDIKFRTNLMGLIRFRTQCGSAVEVGAYGIMYIAIVIYTCIFTFMYFKRFLYMAFFTMIAPLVALTYPIDKAGDGKSQAFNMWFKEYTMNVIIQPVHLIIYTVFVSSAIELASKNLLYALVAIAFIIPAEKFIKSMFGLDKAKSTSSFGSFAGGALAMKGLQKLGSGGPKGQIGKGPRNNEEEDGKKPLFAKNPNSTVGDLSTIPDGGLPENGEDDSVDAQTRNERNMWNNMANDENETNQNRMDAQNEVNQIDSRLEEERSMWQNMVDDPNETEQNKLDAQREIDRINGMMAPPPNDKEEEGLTKSNWATIKGIAGNKAKKYWGQKGQLARKVAVNGARLAGRATGVVGGTMIGLGAGLTTGDMSKVFQYGAAGAVAGNAFGAKAGNLTESAISAGSDMKDYAISKMDEWDEEKNGLAHVQGKQTERQNRLAEKAFMQDEKEQKRYRELATKMNYSGDYKELMKQAIDYKKAGVGDDMIGNALKAEYRKDGKVGGDSHKQYLDVAAFATKEGFDSSNISSEKKRKDMDNMLEDKYGKQKGYAVGKTMADIYGLGDTYNKRSALSPGRK